MALLSRKKEKVPGEPVTEELEERIRRGRERLQTLAVYRDEAWEFYRGNHYAYVGDDGKLAFKPTVTTPRGTGKQSHRVRRTRNHIFDIVLREASAASQRVPSYQVLPSTSDPEDVSAARLSEKIMIYGYDRWKLRRVTMDMVTHAVVGGEAFAWVYFDNTIGPFATLPGLDGKEATVGRGDVRAKVFGGNEVYWEPGLRFEESQWHVIEHARSLDQVYQTPGYLGGKLSANADTRSVSQHGRGHKEPSRRNLVLTTEYLERPSVKHPEGRWITMANDRRIMEDRPYPGTGEDPCLRKLSYASDPNWDRDLGLVPQLLDAHRSFNDSNNKAEEWKVHCLVPRLVVQPGMMNKQRWTDEPGKIYEIPRPNEFVKVIETPPIPPELFTMADRATSDMDRISARTDVSGMESGKQVQAAIESDAARRQAFIADLATVHGGVAHDCLVQVQDHYTEGRLIQFKDTTSGWESIPDFRGAQLNDQVDVRVFPDSIEPQTREVQEAQIVAFADRGWISPQEAMTAMTTRNFEGALRSVELDKSRASQIIQRIKADTFWTMAPRPVFQNEDPGWEVEPVYGPEQPVIDPATGQPAVDPMTGQPQMEPTIIQPGIPATTMPGWMPRPLDNVEVHLSVFPDWMKTVEYDSLPPEQMQAANTYYSALLDIQARQAQREAELQTQMAEDQGMKNAARDQGEPKPMPDQSAEVFGPRYQTGSTDTF